MRWEALRCHQHSPYTSNKWERSLTLGHRNQRINRTTYPINALRHKVRPSIPRTIYKPLLDSFQPGRLQPPAQLRREIPTHTSQREDLSQQLDELAQSWPRIFWPVDVEFDELDPAAGLDEADEIRHDVLHGMMGSEAEALVHEVEAALPVVGPRFGDVLRGEGRVGGELGGKSSGSMSVPM